LPNSASNLAGTGRRSDRRLEKRRRDDLPALSPNRGATVNAAWLPALPRVCWRRWRRAGRRGRPDIFAPKSSAQVRGPEVPTGQVERVVDLTVEEVLEARPVSASHDPDSLLLRFLLSTYKAPAAKGNADRRALDSKPVF
jgi:hypothetical protein